MSTIFAFGSHSGLLLQTLKIKTPSAFMEALSVVSKALTGLISNFAVSVLFQQFLLTFILSLTVRFVKMENIQNFNKQEYYTINSGAKGEPN